MKVIMWMGISANGFIARLDNSEDFISHECWLSWLNALKEQRCLIIGRKTFDTIKNWDAHYIEDLKDIRVLVISSQDHVATFPGFEFVKSPIEAIKILESEGYKYVILTGGGELNGSFANLGLIDEVLLNIHSVLVPSGIPLLSNFEIDLNLKLLEINKKGESNVELKYEVIK